MSQITEIIKRLRAPPHSLSQNEISKKTGIPQYRVCRWEAGNIPAGIDGALALIALDAQLSKQPRKQRTTAQVVA